MARKIIGAVFVSLDGVIQAPGGPDEDKSGGFAYGGWLEPLGDEALEGAIGALFDGPFNLLPGRRTYDIFAGYWPFIDHRMRRHTELVLRRLGPPDPAAVCTAAGVARTFAGAGFGCPLRR